MAYTAAYTALFAFGDSLSDAGNDWIVDGKHGPRISLLPGAFQQRAHLGRGSFHYARPRDAKAEPRGRQ
jgi:hypothetical protein